MWGLNLLGWVIGILIVLRFSFWLFELFDNPRQERLIAELEREAAVREADRVREWTGWRARKEAEEEAAFGPMRSVPSR